MKIITTTILVLCLIAIPLSSASAQKIIDISPTHWAYQIVSDLISRGFLSLYDDGSFLGQKEVTRYQLAEALAQILTYIESTGANISGTDVNNIRLLTVEFRKELVELAEDLAYFQKRVVELEENKIIGYEDMGKIHRKMDDLQLEVSKIINEIVQLYALQKQTNELEKEIIETKNILNSLNYTISGELEENLRQTQIKIQKIEKENRQMKLIVGGLAGIMAIVLFLNLK